MYPFGVLAGIAAGTGPTPLGRRFVPAPSSKLNDRLYDGNRHENGAMTERERMDAGGFSYDQNGNPISDREL